MWPKIKNLFLQNRDTRQTVAKNTFWLSVSNFGGRFLRAILIIYAARVLGAGGWGVFSYAVSLVAFITSFTDIGINAILIREAVKAGDDSERRKVISTSFITKLAGLLLGVIAIIFITPHITNVKEVSGILSIVVFILIFDTFRDFGFYVIRSLEKMEWEAALFLFTNAAIVLLGIGFLTLSPTVKSLAYSYAIGDALGMVATLVFLGKRLSGILSNFSKSHLKTILLSAWPLAITSFLGVLMINADILVIGWLKSAEDIGLYSAAQRIVQITYLLPSIINVSVLPTFARLARKNNEKMRRVMESIVSLVFAIGIPISVGGFILGKSIILFFFGQEYVPGAPSFQILILTILADFPATILAGFLFSYDRQRTLIINGAVAGTMNILLDFLLIPRFGITGSAIATLLAQFISMRYLWWVAKRTNHFQILSHLKRVFIAAAAMAFVAFGLDLLSLNIIATIILSGSVYIGTLFLLKEPLIKEMKLILHPASAEPAAQVEPSSI
ncbi:MAG: flippase [Candidatus Liptonbacteria bacterium]|nr:flippase [Candidatus Liptonbacteria bacterium]